MEAIPLIVYNEKTGKHSLNAQGLQVIAGDYDNIPVAVVSVIGKFRTGKSYLMNRLAHGLCKESVANGCTGRWTGKSSVPQLVRDVASHSCPPTSFNVGHSQNSTTHGIYIYPVKIPLDSSKTFDDGSGSIDIIILDTEGLSSSERSDDYDHKIYALSMMLSSVFIYNTSQTFEREGFDTLSMATAVLDKMTRPKQTPQSASIAHSSNSMQTSTTQTSSASPVSISPQQFLENRKSFAPSLYWVMRNWSGLIFSDPVTKQPITPTQHLRSLLEMRRASKLPNSTVISELFGDDVVCYPLYTPSFSPEVMRKLDKVTDFDLNLNFVLQCDALVKDIAKRVLEHPKHFEGNPLRAHHIVSLLKRFVASMNVSPDSVPHLPNAWKSVVRDDIEDLSQGCMDMWRDSISSLRQFYPSNDSDDIVDELEENPSGLIIDPLSLRDWLHDERKYPISYLNEGIDSVYSVGRDDVVRRIDEQINLIMSINERRIKSRYSWRDIVVFPVTVETYDENEQLVYKSIAKYSSDWTAELNRILLAASEHKQTSSTSEFSLPSELKIIDDWRCLPPSVLSQFWFEAMEAEQLNGTREIIMNGGDQTLFAVDYYQSASQPSLLEDVVLLRAVCDEKEKALSSAKEQASKYEASNKKLSEMVEDFSDQLDVSTKKVSVLSELYKYAEDEIAILKSTLEGMKNTSLTTSEELSRANVTNNSNLMLKDEISQKYEECLRRIQTLVAEVESLNSELSSARSDLASSRMEHDSVVEEFKRQIELLNHSMTSYDGEIQALSYNLALSKQEIQDLKVAREIEDATPIVWSDAYCVPSTENTDMDAELQPVQTLDGEITSPSVTSGHEETTGQLQVINDEDTIGAPAFKSNGETQEQSNNFAPVRRSTRTRNRIVLRMK